MNRLSINILTFILLFQFLNCGFGFCDEQVVSSTFKLVEDFSLHVFSNGQNDSRASKSVPTNSEYGNHLCACHASHLDIIQSSFLIDTHNYVSYLWLNFLQKPFSDPDHSIDQPPEFLAERFCLSYPS